MPTGQLNVGLVGAAGRAGTFRSALEANGAHIRAVCDIREDELEACRRRFGAEEAYRDYEQMLDKARLDAVVIGTPMHLHATQAIAALQRNIHVLSEVPAAVSLDECRQLVAACRKSSAIYMMAENYTYMRSNVLVRELARRGLFGETYYAEGEYLHELKQYNEQTPWRRKWQTGIEGITYPTHSLGPILQWMGNDRVTRLCCEGGRHHYKDPRGEPYHSESPVMLCKTTRGALIKIRVDMVSDRPHAMTNYQLQGTDGVYESSRGGPGERHKIWLRKLSASPRWLDLETLLAIDSFAGEYLPEAWRQPPPEALAAGHGGGDYFEVLDFLNAITGKAPCPIGIHEAMDMTLPGLISQQSIQQDGAWLAVPDSRSWTDGPPYQQLHMVLPPALVADPPRPRVPDGYELRQFVDADEPQWLELINRCDLGQWDSQRLQSVRPTILPDGHFVIIHKATGSLVATSMAHHRPTALHPWGGEVGWIAADERHKGRGLGMAVTAAAAARLARAGYRHIYLSTDDHRLAAIKTYLKLGFEPMLYAPDMEQRWRTVKAKIGWHA